MTAPKHKPVTDERIASYLAYPNQWDDDETVHGIYADAQAMAAELRARRAAALSEADREALGILRGELGVRARHAHLRGDMAMASAQERYVALLDRLLGRSAT